ncbi:MAG: glycosyltransferase family 2 protein [Chloroflexi bacterium]|nr:glycosyltransferase family 2 protein [Chloroflexota bacterium]
MSAQNSPSLSLVIPAYNEAAPDRLPASISQIADFVRQQSFPIEVIIVNNNSKDDTQRVIDEAAAEFPFIKPMFEAKQGKGAAVHTGMMAAQYEYVFICDADLSMTVEQVLKFLPPQHEPYDIAIASREGPGAKRVDEPPSRHFIGRVFNMIVRIFAVHGFQDTQCGFKCFRREIVHDICPYQTMQGWSFDVELLHIAQKRGYKIVDVPITWYYKNNSKIKPIRDSYHMFRDVLLIRWNSLRGKYKPQK